MQVRYNCVSSRPDAAYMLSIYESKNIEFSTNILRGQSGDTHFAFLESTIVHISIEVPPLVQVYPKQHS